jgi:hypothetical protein
MIQNNIFSCFFKGESGSRLCAQVFSFSKIYNLNWGSRTLVKTSLLTSSAKMCWPRLWHALTLLPTINCNVQKLIFYSIKKGKKIGKKVDTIAWRQIHNKWLWLGTSFNESLECENMNLLGHLKRHPIPQLGHWALVCPIIRDILLLNVDTLLQNNIKMGENLENLGLFHKKNDHA